MKIVILGLSITSSWGNGHATTFRALTCALRARGHEIVFFERDLEWYASNRDLPKPTFCQVYIYEEWRKVLSKLRHELADCDVAVLGSYFPDGIAAADEILHSNVPVKAFYDIDTPITVSYLRSGGAEYLSLSQVPGFDIYFSFTGGRILEELEQTFGAQRAVPLYCSFDAERYSRRRKYLRYDCDLSYMGTYAPDRQPKLKELLCKPAEKLSEYKFIVAGPQYPRGTHWPRNVRRIIHLSPRWHAPLYSSSRAVLNLTREQMVAAGYSPSVRLFEAAACAAPILSDSWPGLETFLSPDREIILVESSGDVVRQLRDRDPKELESIGAEAQARVLSEHTSERRARQFEKYVEGVLSHDRHFPEARINSDRLPDAAVQSRYSAARIRREPCIGDVRLGDARAHEGLRQK